MLLIGVLLIYGASPMAQQNLPAMKAQQNLPVMQEIAGNIPEEPGRLRSLGSQRVGHD